MSIGLELPAAPARPGRPAWAGCLFALLAMGLGFACTWSALMLSARGELTWRLGQPTEARLWLLRGDGLSGVGWSTAEVVSRSDRLQCVIPHVHFWTWRGEAPPAAPGECRCYERQGARWTPAGACLP